MMNRIGKALLLTFLTSSSLTLGFMSWKCMRAGFVADAFHRKESNLKSRLHTHATSKLFPRQAALEFRGGSNRVAISSSHAVPVNNLSKPEHEKVEIDEGTAGVSGSVFNLVKNIVGSGILALPSGVAAFSQAKGAVVWAGMLTVILGVISAYCFSIIGRTCAATGTRTYGDAWKASVQPSSVWILNSSVVAKTLCTCLSYSIIIGDIFSALGKTFGFSPMLYHRPTVLTVISSALLLPLCLMKNLNPLRYTSILGIFGTLYTAVVMGLRYFDGSYIEGGKFFDAAAVVSKGPLFSGNASLNPLALILVSMLSTSFIAHYNAPKFYHELKGKSIKKYNTVVGTSFAVAILLFIAMTTFPFLTFGSHCNGLILNNYATGDRLATMCRLAIGGSIVFGYPLTFITAREGVLSILGLSNPTPFQVRLSTVALLGSLTGLAMVLRNLGFVVAFGGALLGSAVIYIFPAMMWVGKNRKDVKIGGTLTGLKKVEYLANIGLVGLGSLLGILGAVTCILKTFFW